MDDLEGNKLLIIEVFCSNGCKNVNLQLEDCWALRYRKPRHRISSLQFSNILVVVISRKKLKQAKRTEIQQMKDRWKYFQCVVFKGIDTAIIATWYEKSLQPLWIVSFSYFFSFCKGFFMRKGSHLIIIQCILRKQFSETDKQGHTHQLPIEKQ